MRDDKFGRDLLRRKIFPGKIIYFSISFTTKKNSTHRRAIKLKENDEKKRRKNFFMGKGMLH